ncbi:MAG: YciK family oxidoreductase [Gammaproteobacteria bacterium]|jgi:NAD(P)-dependent dehydrogenase (short-subunit alcohol dehydrogenase family)
MEPWENWQPEPELLRDRVILVTGAGDGIGKACARSFGAHGATVILLGRTIRKLEAVYDEIEQAGHPQPAIYPLDLEGATVKHYEELAATVEREFGRLDGLLHNAAMLGALTPMTHYETALWYQVLQINLNAPFMLTHACLPLLMRTDEASVVFTSDRVGRKARAYWGAYAVSKFGLEALMQILADETEVNTRLRFNSVDPGPVHTRMRTLAYPGEDPRTLLQPEDVVKPFLYLMSPASDGVTGQQFSAQRTGSPAPGVG